MGNPSQGFGEGDKGIAIEDKPSAIAERAVDRLANDDPGILGGVMKIDVEIALGRDLEIHQAVARQLLEHMVEKSNPGGDLIDPVAVEPDGGGDSGFLGTAKNHGFISYCNVFNLLIQCSYTAKYCNIHFPFKKHFT